jgi:hypothetical protein
MMRNYDRDQENRERADDCDRTAGFLDKKGYDSSQYQQMVQYGLKNGSPSPTVKNTRISSEEEEEKC